MTKFDALPIERKRDTDETQSPRDVFAKPPISHGKDRETQSDVEQGCSVREQASQVMHGQAEQGTDGKIDSTASALGADSAERGRSCKSAVAAFLSYESGAPFPESADAVVKRYATRYTVTPCEDDTSVLLLLIPYEPFARNDDMLYVDAYYTVSNAVYHRVRAIKDDLGREGIEVVGFPNDFSYKYLAARSGLTVGGAYNTLGYTKETGSYFYLQAVRVNGLYAKAETAVLDMNCARCSKCVDACPVGALDGHGGIDADGCLRARMSRGTMEDDATAEAIGNSVLGCDRCQTACPFNAHVKKNDLPSTLDARLKDALRSGNAKPLAPLLGANVARNRLLINLIINACGNLGIERDAIAAYRDDVHYAINARRAVRRIDRIRQNNE